MRKIIQIDSYIDSDDDRTIVALCDDGRVWEYWKGEWYKVKAIPQDESFEDEFKKTPLGKMFNNKSTPTVVSGNIDLLGSEDGKPPEGGVIIIGENK